MALDYDKIAEEHKKDYGRKTDHLRFYKRLYSDKTHFVYELIQNADDSKSQHLDLQLGVDALFVWNDGRQFDERDVRNICSIGTTGKDLTQIGNFGIGFKAVYNYTDLPEIYSDDERFRIRDFTRPEGIDKVAPRVAEHVNEGRTVFRLPFKENLRQEEEIKRLKDRLCNLYHGRSLLFLRHLERIAWRNEHNTQMGSYACHRHQHDKIQNASEIELTVSMNGNNQSFETFLVFRKEVQPQQDVIDELLYQAEDGEEKRRIQQSAKKLQPIEIAFKVQDGKIAAMDDCVLFAYLPTQKETHLKFLIQARYQTTPARDNIPEPSENPWNRWLVQETADFFPEVLEQLRDGGLLETTFFNLLPLEGEVENEFKPIAKALKNAMKERALIPTKREGHYAKAENVFYPDSTPLRKLVKSSGMFSDSELLHPDIQNNEKFRRCFKVMREAGVEPIRVGRVLTWLEGQSVKWFETRSNKLLRSLYTYLKEQESHLERIKKLPLVRLEDGQHVCTSNQLVFFPPDTDEDLEEIKPLLNDLPILKSTVLRKEGYNDIKAFLEDIGVEVLRPENLISGSICPLYSQSDKPSVMKNRRHVRYIFKSWQKAAGPERSRLEESVSEVPILRAYKGTQRETSDFVVPCNAYLPQAYTGDNDLETYFSVSDSNLWFVDDKYLTKNSDTKAWLQFLKAIGAMDTPLVMQRNITRNSENYENYQEFSRELAKRNIELEYTTRWWETSIKDRCLYGLPEMLDKIGKYKETNLACSVWQLLVKMVYPLPSESSSRNTFFINLFQGVYRWFYRTNQRKFFDATFYRQLKSIAWIPDKQGKLHKPSECFAPTSENRELLGDSVFYLPDSFNISTGTATWLAEQLGVRVKIDAKDVLKRLRDLSGTDVSVKDVEPLYRFLYDNRPLKRVESVLYTRSYMADAIPPWRQTFNKESLIFIPEPKPHWRLTDEVFWKNEREVFGDDCGYLKAHYGEHLKSFFTKSLEVPECAGTLHYIRGIKGIKTIGRAKLSDRKRLKILYRSLWMSLQKDSDWREDEEWIQVREDNCWLGKIGGEWGFFSPQELVWRDDDLRSDLFKDKVRFWPFSNGLLEFAKELGVKGCYQNSDVKFSYCGNQEEDIDWSAKVCNLNQDIYDFLNSPLLCGEREEEKSAEILTRLSVRRVEKLEVKFELNGISVPDPNPRQSFLEETVPEAILWLALEASENQYPWLIGDALQEYFGDVKELSAYIEDLLTKDRESVLTRWKQKGLRTNIGLPSPEEDSKEDENKPQDPVGDELPDETGNGDDSGTNDSDVKTPAVNKNTGIGKGSPDSTTNGSGNPSGPSGTGPSGGHWGGTSSGGGSSVGGHGGRGGGGEGEKHRALKKYLAGNPSLLGPGLKLCEVEYTFDSNDRVDILLKDSAGKPITVEVETHIPSGNYVGVWQAVKYKHLAAVESGLRCEQVRSILAAPEIPEDVKEKCKELKIEPIEVSNQMEDTDE